ncbi:MAG: hypoxanthine phosphoribosyltransferase [Chitinophagaceae bacterium]|nr:hypoxanthine phosphoribosyltransferase [Chitinophagaceae bacterium]
MTTLQVLDKSFIPFLSSEQIALRIQELADQINKDYLGRNPIFIGILNGSFMFASDLYKLIKVPSTISFIKLVSYKGTSSTGTVITSIGLEEDLNNKDIILIEDIVDTGKTMSEFIPTLMKQQPNSVKICTLLQKPEALQHPLDVHYVGFNIPNKFVVGYGLDYDGYGRNSQEIFQLAE